MTDVEAKTPTKRKSGSFQEKKGSVKKPKVETAKTPKKPFSPKQQNQKQNNPPQKQDKKKGEQKKESPNKPKAFAGTKAINAKADSKQTGGGAKKQGPEGKKKNRSRAYSNLKTQLSDPSKKQEAAANIDKRIKDLQSRGELTKTAKKNLRLFLKLKSMAEGKPAEGLKELNAQIKAETGKVEKKNTQNNVQKKQPQQAKQNGKPAGAKPQIQKPQKKNVPQKQLQQEDSDDDDEDEEDESGDDEELDEEDEDAGEESDDESEGESDDEEEVEGEEEESDEESEEEVSPPPAKVSNKNQKKK